MANDFGAYLKHERELRSVPLEEIANATKIHIKYLQALEENEFDKLPGEVFIKGFIRSYAKCIGADVDELLTAYDESAGQNRENQAYQFQSDKAEEQRKKQIYIVNSILGSFLAIFLVIGFIYLVQIEPKPDTRPGPIPKEDSAITKQTTSPEKITEPSSPETPLKSSEIPPSGEEQESSKDATSDPADTESTPASPTTAVEAEKTVSSEKKDDIIQGLQDQSVPTSGAASETDQVDSLPLVLEIKVTENSWFNLTVDDQREEDFILPGGSTKKFRAKDQFRLTIGNQRGTEVTLNGNPVALPKSADNVVRNLIVKPQAIE